MGHRSVTLGDYTGMYGKWLKHVFTHMRILEEAGILLIRNLASLLRMYVYETPEFVTAVVHGSTLHCKTIIANCCNISHARFFHVILCLVMNTI